MASSSNFGDPQYQAQDPAAAAAGDSPSSVVIDANDPQLTSEVLTEDTTQDAFAIPPPPPDGKWRAKLKLVDMAGATDGKLYKAVRYEKMNDGKAFFVANVEASLIDVHGKQDGIKVTQYHVKSAIDRRKNVSEMTTITKAAGGKPVERGTHLDKVVALGAALAGEPEVIIDTFWEAACQSCQEGAKKAHTKAPRAFLMGMSHFPQSKPGTHDPMVQCPACKSMVRAQLRIGQFLNVKEAKATRGVA
jgi:hypothetical protein